MLCGPPLHRCDGVSRRDWIDDAGRQGAEGQRKPDRVECRDSQQAAGHLWVVGDDDIQRDQVEEPGEVGERPAIAAAGTVSARLSRAFQPTPGTS